MEDVLEAVKNLFKNKFNVRFIQSCKRESKNGTFKSRLLVLTDYRIFFILKSPLCVEKFFYLIDIKGLECLSPDRLSITSGSKTVFVVADSGFTQTVREILSCLKRIHSALPAQSLVQKLSMPSQRILDDILRLVDKLEMDVMPCGSFSVAYRCMCDFFAYPCLEDVIWDVEAIYYLHDSKEFNFRDFDYLDSKYHIPILAALQHNSYFTGLNFSNIKMVHQNVTELAKVLRNNSVIKYLNLSNTSLKSNHVEKLCESISANQHSSLSFLDVSRNNLDEKSIINFTSLSLNWEGLILSETSLSQSALVSLFGNLSENSLNFKTLTHIDLSRNVLKKDARTALFDFLCHPNALERLILESCEISLEKCFDNLLRGCVDGLQELNLSGSHVNRKKLNEGILFRWKEFFSTAQSLKTVCLNHCQLSHEALKSILLGLAVNPVASELDLRLSGNNFDSKLLDVFEVCLPLLSNKVTSLDLSNNSFVAEDFKVLFDKLAQMKKLKKLFIGRNLQNSKPKNLEVAVEALVNYLKQDELELECLHIDEMSLRSESFLFLNHLGGDTHLVELNISANYIGPAGACLLSKALQINCMLKKILMDKNEFNIQALHDIAHALSRNYFLKSLSMPFYDILAIQRANPDRSEKLEEVIKKIECSINRNNNPSLLLQDKSFTSKFYLLQTPLLDDLVQAASKLQNAINDIPESLTSQKMSQIERAKVLIKETHSFIKTYSEYHTYLRKENTPKGYDHDWERLMRLLKKLRSSGSNYQTESVHHLVLFLSKTCPKNFELIKEKINFSEVKLQEIIMSPTLAKIIEDTESTLNVAVPFAALELMKVLSELLASNLADLTNSLTTTPYNDIQDSISENFCRIRGNSSYLKSRRSTLKEEIKGLNESLLETSFLKAARMTRPTSSVIASPSENPGFLYLPTISDSLEHLNLQRPKPPKKYKATVPILKIGMDSIEQAIESDKAPKPLPRKSISRAESKPRPREPDE